MRTSSKLLLSGLIVAVAVRVAWQYRRPSSEPANADTTGNAAFFPPLERRLAGTGGNLTARQPQQPPLRVPTAATSFWPKNSADLPDLPPNYHQVFSPVGAILQPIDTGESPHLGRNADSQHGADVAAHGDDHGQNSQECDEPLTHEIKDGDSLSALAERYLGNPARAADLFAANRDVLTSPDLLPLGKVLRIPPRKPTTATPPAAESTTTDNNAIEPPVVPIPRGALSQ